MDPLASVEAALEAHDDDAVEDAVRDLIGALDDVADGSLADLCARLHDSRAFDALGLVADAAIANGRSGRFWADLAQAHIERGRYATATAVLERALDDACLAPDRRPDLRGLQARILKDRYLSHRNGDDLAAAVDAYAAGVREGGDLLWLGVNAHSLAHRGRRDAVEVPPLDIPSEHELLAAAAGRAADDDWAAATLVEANLLVGLPAPVDLIVGRLADASPFAQASLRRQLTEVWGFADDHPAIVTLSEFLLRSGATTTIELPDDAGGYEKLFGDEWPVSIDTYRLGLHAAESVGHLMLQGQVPIGTGFVVAGDDLHPALAGRTTFITNEHVVPSPERADGAPATALSIRFDAHAIEPIGGLRAVWFSDRHDLDVTILVADGLDGSGVPVLRPADALPPVMPGAHVYVVGHPGGRSLCLSIRGNDLIDHDGVRIHYRAPTEKGSSGSPVFDQAWNLIAVHHYGSARLPRLNGATGTYGGNEGTTIVALRDQLAQRGITP